jgi:hypothetical protein
MSASVPLQAATRRDSMRPVEIGLPDTSQPGFAAECRRQSRLAAEAEAGDADLGVLLDAALGETTE